MRKKKILSLCLAMIVMVTLWDVKVDAVEFNEGMIVSAPELETKITTIDKGSYSEVSPLSDFGFTDAIITVSHGDNGMDIDIATYVSAKAMVVGVKDIVVWHKNDKGKWDKVAVSSGGELFDCTGMGSQMTYTGAVWGDSYKITCVHYAQVGSTFRELKHDTEEFVYNFALYASKDF